MKLKTSNQQLLFVLVTFAFHILIRIFLLHPILLYSEGPNCSASSQTSFLWGQWLGCGQGSQPRAGQTWESGWSSGHIGVGCRWDGSQRIQLASLFLGMKVTAHSLLFVACYPPGPLKSSLHILVCWTPQARWKDSGNFYWEMSHV